MEAEKMYVINEVGDMDLFTEELSEEDQEKIKKEQEKNK